VVAHPTQIRQTNKTVDLKAGWKRRAKIEKTRVRLLAVFIALIPFYYDFGIKEFESEQAPVSIIFRRMGNIKPKYLKNVYSVNILILRVKLLSFQATDFYTGRVRFI
jgi:hypothetical protein